MKLFNKYSYGRGTIICQPANDVPAAECPPHWLSGKGVPLQFVVKFTDGVAEVADVALAKYLLSKGHAFKTPNH